VINLGGGAEIWGMMRRDTGDPAEVKAMDDLNRDRPLLSDKAAMGNAIWISRQLNHKPLPDIAGIEKAAMNVPAERNNLDRDRRVLPDTTSTHKNAAAVLPDEKITNSATGARRASEELHLEPGPSSSEAATSDHAAEAALTQIRFNRGALSDPADLMSTVMRGATIVFHLD